LPNHLKVGNIKEHSGDSTMLENVYNIIYLYEKFVFTANNDISECA